MHIEELHAKFTDCAQLTMSADRIPKLVAQIETVDALKDIRQLARMMAADATAAR